MNLKNQNNIAFNNINHVRQDADYKTFSNDEDKDVLAERVLQDYALNRLPTDKGLSVADQLNFLDRKLTATRKTITAWDSYHITGMAQTPTEVKTNIVTLLPNTSFIVNTDTSIEVSLNDEIVNVSKGDLIYKGISGRLYLIPIQSGGFYYPFNIEALSESSNTYKITYKYDTLIPKVDTKGQIDGKAKNGSEEMIKEITTKSEESVYNFHKTVIGGEFCEFDYQTIENTKDNGTSVRIEPIIYWYLDGERVYLDNDIQTVSEKGSISGFKITNTSNMVLVLEVR